MALSHPFVIYGKVYNTFQSKYESSADVDITFADGTEVTVTTDSSGFYEINIQPYANDGEDIEFNCIYKTYEGTGSYTLDITDVSHEEQIDLDEEISNLQIWYGSASDEFITCWCSNWIERDNKIIVTTTLNKTQLDYLKNNTRPGAVREKKIIGYGYMTWDATFTDDNTLTFTPYETGITEMHNMKSETTGYVLTLSISPMPGQKRFVVRIEAVKASS